MECFYLTTLNPQGGTGLPRAPFKQSYLAQVIMEVGDIVRVRLGDWWKIGIIIEPPRKMYMIGHVAGIMVDGRLLRVKQELIQTIEKSERKD